VIKLYLQQVMGGENLSTSEASEVMELIMSGNATPAQIAAMLVALRQKGETAEEVAGFVTTMRKHAVPVTIDDVEAVDGCGTGGDGAHTFNISTAAAVVTAAAGASVAKHGNRSISSQCGSADLLEAAGGNIDPGPETVAHNIKSTGFGFMFAPRFHPAMKHAAGPRRELGVRTVFNMLGPMSNPAGVVRQVVGVYDRSLLPLMIDVLEMTGSRHVIVAHSRDGLDEFSVAAPTDYIELRDGRRNENLLEPEQAGLTRYDTDSLRGGDAGHNLAIFQAILDGEAGPYRDAVLLNAGAMIFVGGRAGTIGEGVRVAVNTIDDGSAAATLKRWIHESKGR